MMMDASIVVVSPATVYRVRKEAGCLTGFNRTVSKKSTGFEQPLQAYDHWHIDISYLNIAGTFGYMCFVLDGYSRSLVAWGIREQMKEVDVSCIIEAGTEAYPAAKPRIISDNGPQFIAKEFQSYLRIKGMDHVRTSPYYPPSNDKVEHFNKSMKAECIRLKTPLDLNDAKKQVEAYMYHCNTERLHATIGYLAPHDKLAGKAAQIHQERDEKIAAARQGRKRSAKEQVVA